MMTELLVGLAILVGLVGVVVPVLPGGLLVLAAIGVWSYLEATATGWTVFAVATALVVAAGVAKYVWPGRRMVRSGIPRKSLVIGGLAGIAGFFLLPVVGLPVGFVGGTYLAEYARMREQRPAWRSTVEATKAAGLSILIELAGALLAAGLWLLAVTLV